MKRYNITVNGTQYDVMVEEADAAGASAPGHAPERAFRPLTASAQGSIKIESPMPGTIVSTKAAEGEKVAKGTVVAVLEAMKMENDIVAPSEGIIISMNVKKGDTVNTGTVIATMENI